MAIESFANNATSTLSSAINSAVTSVPVSDGSKFPSSGQFRIKINNELMLCTARVGNDLTVARGQEGTFAAAHGSGDQVSHIVTAGALAALKADTVGEARGKSVASVTTDYTVLAADNLVAVGALSAPATITLPATPSVGQTHTIKDVDGSANTHNITVDGNGANIDAAATSVLSANYANLTVCWTGSKWSVI